jgi:predicted nucleic acid-binding protein
VISVLDASVAVKWFAPDGDGDDSVAEALLRAIAEHPRRFVVPELFVYEVFSVLCRRLRQARDVNSAVDRLVRLGIRRVRLDEALVRRAARLAYDRRITGYDACYAALAFELDGRWLTFDRAAHSRVEALGICDIPG